MGPDQLGVLIPIFAVVGIFGGGIIKSILRSQERRMEMRLQMQQGQNDQVSQRLQAIQAEIAALRDTTTQFDISIEHTVQRLEERVSRIETKTVGTSLKEETPQQIGLRQG